MTKNWYNTGRPFRFFGVDGRIVFLLALCMYHPRLWTLGVALATGAVLMFLEYKGYTIPNALRRLRVLLMGRRRPAVIGHRLGRSDR